MFNYHEFVILWPGQTPNVPYPASFSRFTVKLITINYTWRSGRIFGVPVDLHWSFLLIPFAILYLSWLPGFGLNQRALIWYSSVAVLLFGFILLHELGHALAARNRGVRAERIILFPLGGGAYLPEQPKQVWAEVFVYAAGPLANLLLALIGFTILMQDVDGLLILKRYANPTANTVLNPTLSQQLLGVTVMVNLLLALGNLLPAYPLDGGR
ncbi:MAG: M50 family metallopeptidase, partial [Bacteroidota bacterium]